MLKPQCKVSRCVAVVAVSFRIHSFIIKELKGRFCKAMLAEASRAMSNILFCLHVFHLDVPPV